MKIELAPKTTEDDRLAIEVRLAQIYVKSHVTKTSTDAQLHSYSEGTPNGDWDSILYHSPYADTRSNGPLVRTIWHQICTVQQFWNISDMLRQLWHHSIDLVKLRLLLLQRWGYRLPLPYNRK